MGKGKEKKKMISNPYKILGISPEASNDEVKKAYRDLSRKYHPDSYVDNPLSDLAEEKFKEVQEAYEQIMSQRQNSGYGGGGYQYSGNSSGDEGVEMQAVINYINSRHYREAVNLLNSISNRDGRWNYCYAVAQAGMGNTTEAMRYARIAVEMEPGNPEYKSFLNQLSWGGQRYQTAGGGYGRPAYGTGNFCCDLWLADTCCECMGGDLCRCI